MAGAAKPCYFERLRVVGVMHLGVRGTTVLTGFAGELAATKVDVGIGSSVGLSTLIIGGFGEETIDTHPFVATDPTGPWVGWVDGVPAMMGFIHEPMVCLCGTKSILHWELGLPCWELSRRHDM